MVPESLMAEIHMAAEACYWKNRAEAAESTLAAVRAIWTTYSRPATEAECVSPSDAMRHIGRALSASPAPQHHDSALLDRIQRVHDYYAGDDDLESYYADVEDIIHERRRTRAQGQGGS